jgi:hypothetical protein
MYASKLVQFDCSSGGDSKCEVITCGGEACIGMPLLKDPTRCNYIIADISSGFEQIG